MFFGPFWTISTISTHSWHNKKNNKNNFLDHFDPFWPFLTLRNFQWFFKGQEIIISYLLVFCVSDRLCLSLSVSLLRIWGQLLILLKFLIIISPCLSLSVSVCLCFCLSVVWLFWKQVTFKWTLTFLLTCNLFFVYQLVLLSS